MYSTRRALATHMKHKVAVKTTIGKKNTNTDNLKNPEYQT